ncbi:hypothetical protein ACFX11_005297 [Malus domestica]
MGVSCVILNPKQKAEVGWRRRDRRKHQEFKQFTRWFAGARSPLVNIVERALLLRGPADIEVFDLSLPVKGDACRVNAWIPAVIKRNGEKFYMYLRYLEGPFSLPLPSLLLQQ